MLSQLHNTTRFTFYTSTCIRTNIHGDISHRNNLTNDDTTSTKSDPLRFGLRQVFCIILRKSNKVKQPTGLI